MAAVSSSSTDAEVRAALDDSASYEEDGSIAKCRAYVTALRIWIRRLSERKSTADADTRREIDLSTLSKEMENARAWMSENGGETDTQAAQVSLADFGSSRD